MATKKANKPARAKKKSAAAAKKGKAAPARAKAAAKTTARPAKGARAAAKKAAPVAKKKAAPAAAKKKAAPAAKAPARARKSAAAPRRVDEAAAARAPLSWEQITHEMPPPSSEEEALYALTEPRLKLIELGSLVRSERIRADLLRAAGTIVRFLRGATSEQRRHLLGFSEAQLRVAVYAGVKLGEMIEQRKVTQGAPADLFARGLEERDRLYMALEGLVDYEPRLAADIEAAHGRVMDAMSLAGSLAALVRLSKDMLSDRASRPARLLELGGVSSEELASIETLADTIKNTGEVPIDAQSPSVSKADLDLQDGICLTHLERLMRIFNAAHDRDPSIPQILPVATQSVFGPRQQLVVQREAPAAPAMSSTTSPAATQTNGQAHAAEWKEEAAGAVEEEASAVEEEASAVDEEAGAGEEEAGAGDEEAGADDEDIKAAREREEDEG